MSFIERLKFNFTFPRDWSFIKKVQYSFQMFIWYPISQPFITYYDRISRSLAFAKKGWSNYDFESAFVWDLISFKLERIHKCLITGHAVQDDNDMKALLEAIEITKRLFAEQYEDRYFELHDIKYGSLTSEFIPTGPEGKMLQWKTSRAGITPENAEQEKQDFNLCLTFAEIDRNRDIERLFEIFQEHQQSWWE